MSFSCGRHGWQHLLQACQACAMEGLITSSSSAIIQYDGTDGQKRLLNRVAMLEKKLSEMRELLNDAKEAFDYVPTCVDYDEEEFVQSVIVEIETTLKGDTK